ncbi:MAG: hypothetical protein HYU56_05110 [Candidatus Aenigmarchaeota archaeon]|nr:hypothetical protein [Candidatus Aenigmarchaeota archaeon]
MGKMHTLLALLLFALPAYAQQEANITFDIQPDSSVKHAIVFSFSSPLTAASIDYALDGIVRDTEVSGGGQKMEHELIRSDSGYIMRIFLKGPTRSLSISYTADNVVFRSDSVNHFFTELSFEQPTNISARLELPAGYGLYQDSYRPAGASTVSDGRRIILLWRPTNVQSVFFSVKFAKLEEGGLLIASVAVLSGLTIFLFLYLRHKTREEFLRGFREDEKRVIEYLQERKTALQSDLEHEFKFSRAKATRIVSKLQEKNLVGKQKYGRTNKLFWLK